MKRIKVGFVGAGFIGPVHMENLRRLGFVDIAAVAEINQETANKAAQKLSIPKAYDDWGKLVADPEISVVHISCANILHYPVAKACLEAGKNVVVDKPLTLDTAQAKELAELATEKKLVNAITFNMGFYPMVQEAKEIIAKNELGKIYMVSGRYLQDWLSKDTDYNWRVESKFQGKSRVVADIASHWMNMVQVVLGKKIVSVYGDTTIFIPVRKKPLIEIPTFSEQVLKEGEYEEIKVDTEDHATVLFKFEDGIKGVMIASQVCPGRKNRIEWEVSGSEKSISWNGEEPNQLWIGNRSKPNELRMKDPNLMNENARDYVNYPAGLPEGYGDAWKNIFSKIYNYIRAEGNKKNIKPDFPTFKEGYDMMLIIDAILKSVELGEWVDINR
jgi:predicted dehydrogenase